MRLSNCTVLLRLCVYVCVRVFSRLNYLTGSKGEGGGGVLLQAGGGSAEELVVELMLVLTDVDHEGTAAADLTGSRGEESPS